MSGDLERDGFLFVDSRAVRDFDDVERLPAAYWFLVPADGNDAESLLGLLGAAAAWGQGVISSPENLAAARDLLARITTMLGPVTP